MIFDVRGIGEHVKNSIEHQFNEILRFNVGAIENGSLSFLSVDRW